MTREEAIEMLKSKMDGKTDTSYEWAETVRMAIKALEIKPYQKFESTKDHIFKLAGDYKCWDERLTREEALELCHILEQEPVLDKIRAELHSTAEMHEDGGYYLRDEWIDEYFDKYKAESEG